MPSYSSEQTNFHFISTPAGAGHQRVTLALAEARRLLYPESPEVPLHIFDTPGSDLHRQGSMGFWKFATRAVAQSPEAQLAIQYPIMENKIQRHPTSNPHTFARELSARLTEPNNTLIFTNADVAQIFVRAKKVSQDPRLLNARSVVVVTDNFYNKIHLFWVLGDYLVVPGEQTRQSTVKIIDKYGQKMGIGESRPEIIVNPFPLDPAQEKILPPDMKERRQQALDPYSHHVVPQIALLIGGASVQVDYMSVLVKYTSWWANPYATFKNNPETSALTSAITASHGKLDLVSNNTDMIKALNNQMATTPPEIIVVKPGELSNLARLPTIAHGGGIIFFSQPEGDQEEQNLAQLRFEKLLLNQKESSQLIKDFLGKPARNEVLYWMSRARDMRSICLPKNPYDAARFIHKLYHHGILEAIYLQNQDRVPPNGAINFWRLPQLFP